MVSKKYKRLYLLSTLSLVACGGDGASDPVLNPTPAISSEPNHVPSPVPSSVPGPIPNPSPNPQPEPTVIPEGVAQLSVSLHETLIESDELENIIISFVNTLGHAFNYPVSYLTRGIEIQSGRYTISSYMLGENKFEYALSHDQIELYPQDAYDLQEYVKLKKMAGTGDL